MLSFLNKSLIYSKGVDLFYKKSIIEEILLRFGLSL